MVTEEQQRTPWTTSLPLRNEGQGEAEGVGLDARYQPLEKYRAFAASETKSFAGAYAKSYVNLSVGDASYGWHNGYGGKPGYTATAKIYDGSYKIEVVVRGYLKDQSPRSASTSRSAWSRLL